jgi:hypothetical protein
MCVHVCEVLFASRCTFTCVCECILPLQYTPANAVPWTLEHGCLAVRDHRCCFPRFRHLCCGHASCPLQDCSHGAHMAPLPEGQTEGGDRCPKNLTRNNNHLDCSPIHRHCLRPCARTCVHPCLTMSCTTLKFFTDRLEVFKARSNVSCLGESMLIRIAMTSQSFIHSLTFYYPCRLHRP